LCLFFGIAVLLLVKRHSSGRTTFQGEDQEGTLDQVSADPCVVEVYLGR